MPAEHAHPGAARPRTGFGLASGLPLLAFAALALTSSIAARAVAPALPGSATGIAELIVLTRFLAAAGSQLAAAGAVALCLRLLSDLLPIARLGVALRVVLGAATVGAVLLGIAAAARPLDSMQNAALAMGMLVALFASAPVLAATAHTRAVAGVLVCAASASALHVLAWSASHRAIAGAPVTERHGALAATISSLVYVAGAALALIWASATRRRALAACAGTLLAAGFLIWSWRTGGLHQANAVWVVVHRSLEAFEPRPASLFPSWLALTLAVFPLLAASAVLVLPGRAQDLRASLALCLLGASGTGAPAPTLVSVASVLLGVRAALHVTRDDSRHSPSTLRDD